jgi:uncharacterized membrane protein
MIPPDGATMQIGDFSLAADVADFIEITAIIVIAIGVVVAVVGAVIVGVRAGWDSAFKSFRRSMARGLLVGLDLLIAADIITTVTLEPTLANISALGLLVVIRTFLSWALILESEGHWPWQQQASEWLCWRRSRLSETEEETVGDFLKGLVVFAVAFAFFTFPTTWLLMLFFGNIGMELSYVATLPLGVLVSVLLGGVTSRSW